MNLGIQMLTGMRDSTGHTVSVLVGDVATGPLRDLLEDLKRDASGNESACLLDKEGLVSDDHRAGDGFTLPCIPM